MTGKASLSLMRMSSFARSGEGRESRVWKNGMLSMFSGRLGWPPGVRPLLEHWTKLGRRASRQPSVSVMKACSF